MPTSNGQVTARDIRQSSIKTLHIVDEAVATAKIPDLAVTFPDKIDDPFWVAVAESDLFHNVSLDTTPTVHATASFDVPAWVDQIFVFSAASAQMSNSSGGDQGLVVHTSYAGGERRGAEQQDIPNGDTGSVIHIQTFADTGVAGSTFTVELHVEVSTGTNSSNNGEINAIAIGTRD